MLLELAEVTLLVDDAYTKGSRYQLRESLADLSEGTRQQHLLHYVLLHGDPLDKPAGSGRVSLEHGAKSRGQLHKLGAITKLKHNVAREYSCQLDSSQARILYAILALVRENVCRKWGICAYLPLLLEVVALFRHGNGDRGDFESAQRLRLLLPLGLAHLLFPLHDVLVRELAHLDDLPGVAQRLIKVEDLLETAQLDVLGHELDEVRLLEDAQVLERQILLMDTLHNPLHVD